MRRFIVFSAALAATCATGLCITGLASHAAMAQAGQSQWGYYEPEGGLMQAGVVTADGAQLIFKCDERGDNEVYVAMVAPRMVARPSDRPQARDLRLRFNDGPPRIVAWQHYQQTAVAHNNRRDRQLPLFLQLVADADTLEVRFDPVDGTAFDVRYTVTGVRDAVARIYEACGDSTNPLAG